MGLGITTRMTSAFVVCLYLHFTLLVGGGTNLEEDGPGFMEENIATHFVDWLGSALAKEGMDVSWLKLTLTCFMVFPVPPQTSPL